MALTLDETIINPFINQTEIKIFDEYINEKVLVSKANLTKYFRKLYVLCPLKRSEFNYLYELNISKKKYEDELNKLVLYEVSCQIIKNNMHYNNLLYFDSSQFESNNYFGYDLYPFNEYNVCLYNIYESSNQGEYHYHVDASRSDMYDIKLTIIVNLSNKAFEGGEFYIFNGNEYKTEEINQPGTILILKSYLNHKVSPVISGQRKTLTFFAKGPRLKYL